MVEGQNLYSDQLGVLSPVTGDLLAITRDGLVPPDSVRPGEMLDVLEKILLTRQLEVEDRDAVWRALGRFRRGQADFADYLLGERNSALGCHRTATFDRALEGEEGFLLQ